MLSLICAVSIIKTQTTSAAAPLPQLKTVTSKTGATIAVPVDLGKPVTSSTTSESFKPKAWNGCTLKLTKKPFVKEDAEDSAAVKLEDVVYGELDLSDDRISSVSFGLLQGFPDVDIEGKKKDGARFRYRVCRTKSSNYIVCLTGKTFPADDVVKQVFESFRLPKEPPSGNWSKWLQTPANAKFLGGNLEAWAPTPFAASDNYPELADEDLKGEAHEAEFGYSSYTVSVVNLPSGMEDRVDDEWTDKIIHSEFDEDADGDKATYGEFKSFMSDKLGYRSTTYVNDTIEGRVDVCVFQNKFYMFSVVVPRGMLESDSVKHFFTSIKIH